MAKKNPNIIETEHFGIQRKIVANMTTESWENIPHVTYNYEPDVTEFMIQHKLLNEGLEKKDRITINTIMLRIIVEGLKACPAMNAHIEFDKKLVRGEINTLSNIDISCPMLLPTGEMMTINLHGFENKNLDQMVDYIQDVQRRMKNTNLNEVMFDVSLDNTIQGLKQGKFKQTIQRLIGSKTGKHKVKTLKGKEKREYDRIPDSDKLTKHDIEQGTITVSNLGSLYRGQRGEASLIEIIPPQVCAIAIGAVQDKPVVVTDEDNNKTIEIREVLPLTIVFDHRALDFGDVIPFIKKLDEIFEAPEVIHTWRNDQFRPDEEQLIQITNDRVEREAKFEASKKRAKALQNAEREVEKANRDADKARKEAQKAYEEAQEREEKAKREAEEAAAKEDSKAALKAEKARKEAQEAEEKAQRDIEKAEKEAQEKADKAMKEALEKADKAKDDADEARQKALKEAEKARKDAYEKAEKVKRDAEKKKQEAQEKAEKAMKDAEKKKKDASEKQAKEVAKARKNIEKAKKELEKAEAKAAEAQEKAEKARAEANEANTPEAEKKAEKAEAKAALAQEKVAKAEEIERMAEEISE